MYRCDGVNMIPHFQVGLYRRYPETRALLMVYPTEPLMPVTKTVRQIVEEVAIKYGVTLIEMLSMRTPHKLGKARREAYYRCREETLLSFPQIGKHFGNRCHTTILQGAQQYKAEMGL